MKSKKPKLMEQGHTNEMYTPDYAIEPLIPFLKKEMVIWDCAFGEGHLARAFKEKGFKCIGKKEIDYLKEGQYVKEYLDMDIIVTNPPYSLKDEFLKKAFDLGDPFCFLLPLTALEGILRGSLYHANGIQLIIPNRRIDFITPNGGKSSWFQVAWFCYRMELPNDLNFIELNKKTSDKTRKAKQ